MKYVGWVLSIVFSIGVAFATVKFNDAVQNDILDNHEERIAKVEVQVSGTREDFKALSMKIDLVHSDVQMIKSFIMNRRK